MSLRWKLLLLSLLTLILPWAGWRYATEMETTLRRGQEQALLTTADVLGRVVASQPELLYRTRELREEFDARRGDHFAALLFTQPLIDGFPDEWPVPARTAPGVELPVKDPTAAHPTLFLGVHNRSLHVYVEAVVDSITYESPPTEESASPTPATRVVLLTRDEFGHERAWSISAAAPGPIIVRPCEIGAPWTPDNEPAPYFSGVWRPTARGYAIELRGPLNLFGTQLGVQALGPDNTAHAHIPSGWLHTGSEALKQRLEQYAPEGVRVSVVDNGGWLLARAGSIGYAPAAAAYPGLQEDQEGFTRSIYRSLFAGGEAPVRPYGLPYGMWGPPVDEARAGAPTAIWFEQAGGEPSLVRAAAPLQIGDARLGALVVEQAGEQLALVRELALTRLLNLTVLATLFTMAVTLVFAARLSHRIRRLSRAAATALTPEGRIEVQLPGAGDRDELGALARSYDTLLSRVKEYTSYLQTLGSKLSHELRTPLTIVSSSLENLSAAEDLSHEGQRYLQRARDGAARAHAMLTAMSEATRVEQSIEHTERVKFDVAALVREMGLAYQQTFVGHRVDTTAPDRAFTVLGSPELIAQMLDKLMDNAADFAPEGARITIALEADAHSCRLSVANEGPLLPPHLDGRLFESLVSGRASDADRPHLGLGLYIVRLIAQFHGGAAQAANLPDGSGVIVSVDLPRFA